MAAPQFETPVAKSRPATVTTAAALQILLFVLSVVGVTLTLTYGADVTEAMRANLEAQGAAPDIVNSMSAGDDALSLVFNMAPGLAVLILAFFVLRGSNGARITTWVISGLMLLCSIGGVGIMALIGASSVDGVDFAEATEAGLAAVPSWYNAFSTVSLVVSVLAYLLVIILLALPASNDYFRKDRAPQQIILPGDHS